MKFLPCSFPHNDFLLLGGDARHAIKELAGLRRKVTDDATIFHNVEGDPSRTVSGVIIRDRILTLGEYQPGEREEIAGRYCGVRPVSGGAAGIELVADELGTIPTYYANTAKGPMASNSIRLIALAMKAAGVPVRLSLGSIASTWFTDNFICFSQTSRETYVEGAFLALLGQRIVFRDGAMSVSNAARTKGEPPKIEEYRYLLDKGVDEIRRNTVATVNSGMPVVSTLTGGRDSRIVLGALLSAGRETDVRFSTRDINEDDTRISTGLAEYFGLSYQKAADHVVRVGHSYEDDLERFTLAHMGAKTLYKQANVHSLTENASFRLVGGAGELYRTVFTKGFGEKLLNSPVRLESVKRWLRSYWMFGKLNEEIRELISRNYLDVFQQVGAAKIGEAIDLHYANFRNRHHLGAPTQYTQDEKVVLYAPAASSTLYRLAQRLPQPAMQSDRLVYDLTRSLSFDLAHLPYDKPLHLRNRAVAARAQARLDELLPLFRPNPDLLKTPGAKSVEFRGVRETREFHEFCLKTLKHDMDYLQEHDVAGQVLTEKVRRTIEESFKVINLEKISTWLGKFRAARMVAEMG